MHDVPKGWVYYPDSFYLASLLIVESLLARTGFPPLEGTAAVFLFRHYVELSLKNLIMYGRVLASLEKNASASDVEEIRGGHSLRKLWGMCLAEAKPMVDVSVWNNCDVRFLEKCVDELDNHDNKGFAFRYHFEGGEQCGFDFHQLLETMQHAYRVLHTLQEELDDTLDANEIQR